MRGEQLEAFPAAQFDQRRDEKPIEQTLRAWMTHAVLQRLRVRIARVPAERESTLLEEPQDLREMTGFLAGEARHRPRQARHVWEGGEHRQCVRRRLLLTVGVIDEHL